MRHLIEKSMTDEEKLTEEYKLTEYLTSREYLQTQLGRPISHSKSPKASKRRSVSIPETNEEKSRAAVAAKSALRKSFGIDIDAHSVNSQSSDDIAKRTESLLHHWENLNDDEEEGEEEDAAVEGTEGEFEGIDDSIASISLQDESLSFLPPPTSSLL